MTLSNAKCRPSVKAAVVGLALILGCAALADENTSASDHATTAPDPTVAQIYNEARKGNLTEAQRMIELVISHHPASAKAHFVQAELFYREHKFDMARDQLATAESLSPGLPAVDPRAVESLRRNLKVSR
jgi:Tfp pilus assembly protein PilF